MPKAKSKTKSCLHTCLTSLRMYQKLLGLSRKYRNNLKTAKSKADRAKRLMEERDRDSRRCHESATSTKLLCLSNKYQEQHKIWQQKAEKAKRLMKEKRDASRRSHKIAMEASAQFSATPLPRLSLLLRFCIDQHEQYIERGISRAILEQLTERNLTYIKLVCRKLCYWVTQSCVDRVFWDRTWRWRLQLLPQ